MSKVGDKIGANMQLTVLNVYYENNGMKLLKCSNLHENNRLEAVIEFDPDIYDVKYLMQSSMEIKTLNIDGIPDIYDVFSDKRTTYVSTEFVEGMSLVEYLNEYEVQYEDKIQIVNIIGTAVSYIHKHMKETLYDRIEPNNILVTEAGLVYLLEYGFTKYMKRDALYKVTCNKYIAPELQEYFDVTRVLDMRSDVYSFGALMYYIITEKKPNKNTILADDLDVNMKKIVFKAMAQRLEDRYNSIAEILEDVEKCI